ncbi:transposase, partial [Gallibacterium anatis]|uniref:transposase n=1 Tax=Gallibacterium anatis TaxID=750 RepID=UPI0018AF7753
MCAVDLAAIPLLTSLLGRTFSPDYKVAAVKLVTEQGYSVAQACSELGIGETALRRWIKQ